MFNRILVPLDGSEQAEIAIPYAEELARELRSEVVLYHVPGHEHAQQERMHHMYLDRLAETVKANIARGQDSSTARVTTIVEAGEPSENICKLVDEYKVDLIVMTAVSASGLKIGRMLGSVADHICRTVPIPVLLIRPQNIRQVGGHGRLISRLLIPLDGSDLSRLALPVGEELAVKLKASITLFQMARILMMYENGTGTNIVYANYAQFDEDEKKRVEAEMSVFDEDLKARGLDVTHIVTSGVDAATDTIETEKKIDADLVVMSTHGRSGLSRWVLGNVAERVLRHGEAPLLLVHARAS